MTNGEKIQKDFKGCDVCDPIVDDDIIHVIFADKKDSAIGFDWSWWNMEYKEPTTKNDSSELEKNSKKLEKDFGELDCISRAEVLKAMDTWDKFGYTETGCFVRKPKGDYVPYVKYDDMVNCVKGTPSVTPQESNIKALGEELRKVREGIKDEKVLIGFNMAVAICNKHLEERRKT